MTKEAKSDAKESQISAKANLADKAGEPRGKANDQSFAPPNPDGAAGQQKAPKSRAGVAASFGFIGGVLGGLIISAGAYFLFSHHMVAPAPQTNATEIAGLKTAIAALQTQNTEMAEHLKTAANISPKERANSGEMAPNSQEGAPSEPRQPAPLLNISAIEARIAQNAQNIAALKQQFEMDQDQAIMRDLAKLIAAESLQNSINQGVAFSQPLENLIALLPDNQALIALKPYSQNGLASHSQLAQKFRPIADKISQMDDEDYTADWYAKLKNTVSRLIVSRPVGNIAGTDKAATAARLEWALENGDYDLAATSWQQLPPQAQQLSASFMDQIKARLMVNDVISHIIGDSIKALNAEANQTRTPDQG